MIPLNRERPNHTEFRTGANISQNSYQYPPPRGPRNNGGSSIVPRTEYYLQRAALAAKAAARENAEYYATRHREPVGPVGSFLVEEDDNVESLPSDRSSLVAEKRFYSLHGKDNPKRVLGMLRKETTKTGRHPVHMRKSNGDPMTVFEQIELLEKVLDGAPLAPKKDLEERSENPPHERQYRPATWWNSKNHNNTRFPNLSQSWSNSSAPKQLQHYHHQPPEAPEYFKSSKFMKKEKALEPEDLLNKVNEPMQGFFRATMDVPGKMDDRDRKRKVKEMRQDFFPTLHDPMDQKIFLSFENEWNRFLNNQERIRKGEPIKLGPKLALKAKHYDHHDHRDTNDDFRQERRIKKVELRQKLQDEERDRDRMEEDPDESLHNGRARERRYSIRKDREEILEGVLEEIPEVAHTFDTRVTSPIERSSLGPSTEQLVSEENLYSDAAVSTASDHNDDPELTNDELLEKILEMERFIDQLKHEKIDLQRTLRQKLESEDFEERLMQQIKALEHENAELQASEAIAVAAREIAEEKARTEAIIRSGITTSAATKPDIKGGQEKERNTEKLIESTGVFQTLEANQLLLPNASNLDNLTQLKLEESQQPQQPIHNDPKNKEIVEIDLTEWQD